VAEYFRWNTRLDRQGRAAGTYTTTPCPVVETDTWYFLVNDENPTGKSFTLGTMYHVDGAYEGGDSDGTFTKPWTTVAAALAGVSNGNRTILIRGAHDAFDGIYHESGMQIKLGTDDTHRYHLIGYGQERPVFDAGGIDENIFGSSGATSFPSAAYFTFQRLKFQNTQAHGVQLGTLNSGGERKRDMYVNIIDCEGYMCGCEITNGSSGAFYAMNADNQWRYHCTSGHAYAHAFKIGDGSRNSLTEWSVAYEFGYWAGIEGGSAGHPSGFDYPDCGYNHELRYCICDTGLFYGIQVRGNSSTTYEPQGIGLIKIHHNEIASTTHFDDVEGESGHISPCQVLLYTSYDGCTPTNQIWFYGNIVRDASDAGCYGVYVAGSCNAEEVYIFNNLIYNNAGEQIYISNPANPNVHVWNNTIYADDDAEVLIHSDIGDRLDLKNNILFQAGDANILDVGAATHSYNRFYTGGAGAIGVEAGTGEEDGDPGFSAVPSGAYSAGEGSLSASIPKTDLSASFTVDANGVNRSLWDAGWLETSFGGNVMTAGFFPSTYFPANYFPEDYWPDYGAASPSSIAKKAAALFVTIFSRR
jgi:hypothetical protein